MSPIIFVIKPLPLKITKKIGRCPNHNGIKWNPYCEVQNVHYIKVKWVNSFRCAEDQACGHFKIYFTQKLPTLLKTYKINSKGQFIINITTRAFDQTQLVFLFSLHTKPNQTKHGNHASRKSYKQISVFILVKPSSFEELLGFHIPLILTNTQEFMTFSFEKVVNTIIV